MSHNRSPLWDLPRSARWQRCNSDASARKLQSTLCRSSRHMPHRPTTTTHAAKDAEPVNLLPPPDKGAASDSRTAPGHSLSGSHPEPCSSRSPWQPRSTPRRSSRRRPLQPWRSLRWRKPHFQQTPRASPVHASSARTAPLGLDGETESVSNATWVRGNSQANRPLQERQEPPTHDHPTRGRTADRSMTPQPQMPPKTPQRPTPSLAPTTPHPESAGALTSPQGRAG